MAVGLTVVAGAACTARAPAGAQPSAFSGQLVWERRTAAPVVLSSPMVATLRGIPSVVVGTYTPSTGRSGEVYAFGLRAGGGITGWPVATPGHVGVDATASVNGNDLYVAVGNPSPGVQGGYLALTDTGARRWWRQVPTVPHGSTMARVQASMAVGWLNGAKSVVAGTLGQYVDELRSADGAGRPGFPWMATDSSFDTPAVADLYGSRRNWIVTANDQTANPAAHERQGGHVWVLSARGHKGSSDTEAGANCAFRPDQGVQSSPAVGRILGDHRVGIAFGTSGMFKGAGDTDKVFAVDTHCRMAWKAALDGLTTDSPALVDARGNGGLQVAEGTNIGNRAGTVYLLNGSSGRPFWKRDVSGAVIGGITSADLGGGHQDLLVPTNHGLDVLDGRTGQLMGRLGTGISLQSSPLVTDDPGGRIGVTVAGMAVVDGHQRGVVAHYRLAGTNGRLVDEAGAWPMFHHDPWLTGSTLPRLSG